MTEDHGSVLYDNKSEPGFPVLQRRRRYRLIVSISAITAGAFVVTVVFSPGSAHDVGSIILWLVAISFMALLLVGGLLVDVRRGLGIRVTSAGVLVPPHAWIPAERLKGAKSEEKLGFVIIHSDRTERPLVSVELRDIASPDRFKAAIEALTNR